MAIGTEVILNPGSRLFVEDSQDVLRNAGDDDLVLLVAALGRIGEPQTALITDTETGATPAP